MRRRWANPFLLTGLIMLATTGHVFLLNMYRAFWQDESIWWTPPSLALPPEKTGDEFVLLIDGRRLQKHLSEGTLFVLDEQGKARPVGPQDVRIRLNNWPRLRGDFLARAAIVGPIFGMAVTFLALGLSQVLSSGRSSS